MKKQLLASLVATAVLLPAAALAQSSPGLVYGQVPTAAQWNSFFTAKQDYLGAAPCIVTGCVMTGELVTSPSTTSNAGFNVPAGVAPSAPVNGDVWTTTTGMFVRINGTTIGPLSGGSSASFAGTSPIGVTFPAGVVTYAFDFTVANTFLAQQTNQGATTTSPGWYAQITGDTTPRVRVGMNATDVPSIAFGPGNAVRDAFIERVGAGALRFGAPDAASPVAQTLSVQNVVAGTVNTAGAALTIAGSQGTGTGVGGSILFKVAPAGSTGSTQNALSTALTLDSTLKATFGGAIVATSGAFGGATIGGNALAVTGTVLFNSAVSAGAQITSTVSTGTAPFVVASTTLVANLYVARAALADTATTNANLTGPITSVGNATSIASQTGTGTKFVVDTSPTLVTPILGVATGTSIALGGATLGGNALAVTGSAAISSTLTSAAHAITSASATALSAGLTGATNPAFNVDASTALQVAGLNVKGAATGGTVALSVTDSGSNANISIDAKGSGTVTINGTATGAITLSRATTLSAALTYGGVTLSNAVTGTGNMVLSASPTFSGTVAGSVTFSGNNIYSGTHAITATTLPAQAAGTLGLAGTASAPTLGANSEGDIYLTATGGLNLIGQGSSTDFALINKSGSTVASVATGTTTFNAVGFAINGTSVTTTASTTQYAVVKIDNSTIQINGSGQIAAVGASATTVTVLTTTISGGTNSHLLGSTTSGCSSTTPCLQDVSLAGGVALAAGVLTGTTKQMLVYNPGTVPGNTTRYLSPTTFWTLAAQAGMPAPFGGTVKNLYVNLSGDPGNAQTFSIVFEVNGADQTLLCQVTGNGTTGTTCNDTTHSVTVTTGQLISLKSVSSAGASGVYVNASFEIDNSN